MITHIVISMLIAITSPIWITVAIGIITYPACLIGNLLRYCIYKDDDALRYMCLGKQKKEGEE